MRKLIVVLAVLALLFVGGDRLAARLAEGELERRASAEAGAPVSADIRGFPFLTQALDRRLDHVTLRADVYRAPEGFEVTALDGDLRAVDLTDARRPVAGTVRLDGVLPYRTVERRLRLQTGSLRAAGPERVRVSQRVRLAGETFEASAEARVAVQDGALVVVPTAVDVAGRDLSEALGSRLRQRLTLRYPVTGLPADARVSILGAAPTGFRVRVTATDVELVR